MKKKIAVFAVSTLLFALCSSAEAQQQAEVPRIGFLTNNSPTTFPAGDAAFRLGLRELGYIEGKSIMIEWRYAEGKPGRLQEMLKELIRFDVAVIVTGFVPRLVRVAVFGTSFSPGNAQRLKEVELAAAALGVKCQLIDILAADDVGPAFQKAAKGHADAVLQLSSTVFNSQRSAILQLAAKKT